MTIQKTFDSSITSRRKSWIYLQENFAEEYNTLLNEGKLQEGSGADILWQTSQKFVLKVASPAGRNIVFKSYRKIKDRRKYILRLTPCGLEAGNYQALTNLGFPMARLLAVGEERTFFLVKKAFLITEFAEGYQDGKVFLPYNYRQEDAALRDEFIRLNLQLLAKLHDCGYLHQGFMPGNLLWKRNPDSDQMDLIWIDVATCRKVSPNKIRKSIGFEVGNFFRLFDFSMDKIRDCLNYYLEASRSSLVSRDELISAVETELQRRAAKKAERQQNR